MTDYDKLRQIARAATPGPWITAPAVDGAAMILFGTVGNPENPSEPDILLGSSAYIRDAEFIAAVNPAAVLALLGEMKELRQNANRVAAQTLRDLASDFPEWAETNSTFHVEDCVDEFNRRADELEGK